MSLPLYVVKFPRFHYEDHSPIITSTKKTAPSVYQASYLNYGAMDLSAFQNPGKQFAITNFLHRAKIGGLTAKDIFLGLGKLKGNTSYDRDFEYRGGHLKTFQQPQKGRLPHVKGLPNLPSIPN